MSTKYFVGIERKTETGYEEFVLKNDGTYCPISNVKGLAVFYSYAPARDASHRLAERFEEPVRPFVRPIDRLHV